VLHGHVGLARIAAVTVGVAAHAQRHIPTWLCHGLLCVSCRMQCRLELVG
jgi:hypothetical protein